ncbi:hypothetical protein Mal64_23590 [Pseudobythopirellula maris]|uniref:Uncharacterized protein n=1 Tax=Pseudobythopirellula maris TaxID=2527991 RepID=A0A5C5ZPY8_9BACT|nr:TIGR03009 domain-containing protein [Pseudobythopirellula maris]TWT88871.1 hypothetical protein Mal64_23590 [Pseudobythopirellula maris]
MPSARTLIGLNLCLALGVVLPAQGQAPYAPATEPQRPAGPPAVSVAPAAPAGFKLDAIAQAHLDQVLDAWEKQSGQINTFQCPFERLVYDPVFGPGQETPNTVDDGRLSYQQPDKGSFEIQKVRRWDPTQKTHVEDSVAIGEHWVCDGKSIYEYKTQQKQLVERPIPPEMQGKSIVDGPLPFLFGAEAAKLKARYWLRIDPRSPENQIRLHAMPRFQRDAANYRAVELMLDRQKMLPVAMQVHMPDGSRTVYTFKLADASVNSRVTQIWNSLFQSPRTPYGWTRIVDQQPAAQAAQPQTAPR